MKGPTSCNAKLTITTVLTSGLVKLTDNTRDATETLALTDGSYICLSILIVLTSLISIY